MSVVITFDNLVNTQIKKGLTKPIMGWNSDSFYSKEVTSVIYSKYVFDKSFNFTTNIQIES